jgi:adenine-specific DNA-methyltransferase
VSELDGYNADITADQRQKLKELFPEVFTEEKIDWEKLKATLGEEVELGERYSLGWKDKSGVFAKIQEKTVSTLHPQPEESVNWDTTQNMFIEGDNLEVLKVLHKAYYGKIKMIYIDPPYNTGNDFVYDDNFKQDRREHDVEAGITDEEGNVIRDDGLRVNTGGHKHSNWLNMMYPRLFLARNLLRQDGVIFVSIDDNEVHNLRLMMDEIFGAENFVSEIAWEKMYTTKNDSRLISDSHEYVLCYARNVNNPPIGLLPRTEEADARYTNPDNDPRGPWKAIPLSAKGERSRGRFPVVSLRTGKVFELGPDKHWLYSRENVEAMIADNRIWFGRDGNSAPNVKRFLTEVQQGIKPRSLWRHGDVGSNDSAKREMKQLFGDSVPFDFPKPVTLMKQLLKIGTNYDQNHVILDFFGGSGTLAQAVEELNTEDNGNRQWIMVQLPELTDKKSEAYKAGYKTIAEISRERIRRASAKISNDFADKIAELEIPLDLGFRSYVLDDSNFKKWNELVADPDEIRQATIDSLNPLKDDAKDESLICEILLKRGISPLVEIETHNSFVFVPSESLVLSLSRNMTEELFSLILAKKPTQIILLDQAFNDDVNLKTNLILQAEKQSIIVKVL